MAPNSVYADGAPHPSFNVFEQGVPVLGICYGLQLIAYQLGGAVDKAAKREFGRAELRVDDSSDLFNGVGAATTVWMSHGDHLTAMPPGFEKVGHTENAEICAIKDPERRVWGIQFHPEVHHTPQGKELLKNFCVDICGCKGDWNASSFIEAAIADIRAQVGDGGVICALSGGVDSTVAAVLLHEAIGDQVHCIHVDSGLMRQGESEQIVKLFKENFNMTVDLVNGSDLFLGRLSGVTDPEKKTQDHRQRLHRTLRRRSKGLPRCTVPRTRHVVSGCDRVSEHQGSISHHQDAPQCRGLARAHEPEAH